MAEGEYMYELQDEGQVPESQTNGELYAGGEGEGAYESEMMEEGQAVSSADDLAAYAQQGTGEMPISSSDITTSYAIADESGTQIYYLTEDGVLTTAMPDMGDGTMMLQAVEGGEDGQLQVVYQQMDEDMAPESSTGVQYVMAGGEEGEYLHIAEGAVGSTSMEHDAANVATVSGVQAVRKQPAAIKVVTQPAAVNRGAHVTLVNAATKKPATTFITVQKPQISAGTPVAGSIMRTALQQTPRAVVTIATPGSVGNTPAGMERCNVCKKVNCTTKHRVKFPGESKLNREASNYIVQTGAGTPGIVRGAGPGRPRGSRGRGGGRGGYTSLDISSASDSEGTPIRGAYSGRGGRGGVHVAEGGVKGADGGLQGHWLKAMHGSSLEEVEGDEDDGLHGKPHVEVQRTGAAKTVVMEIRRSAGGEQAKASVISVTKGSQSEDAAKAKQPVVMVTKLPADKEKLAAYVVAEGKKKRGDGEDDGGEWVPSGSDKKSLYDFEEDDSGRKSHRERKPTSKFSDYVKDDTKAVAKAESGTSTQDDEDVEEISPPPSAKVTRTLAVKRKSTPAPVTVTPSQVVLSYGKMQSGGPRQLIVQPQPAKDLVNKGVLCKPHTMAKQTMCRPYMLSKEVQTEEGMFAKPVVIPVPVPLCLPTPMAMYTTPTPYPVPLPIPVPVPCFIPLTKRTAEIILKHIKELSDVEPADPFEAELLHMAEMVAKAHEEAPEEADSKAMDVSGGQSGELAPEDVLQIALRMASEIPEETVVDFEEALDSLAAGAIDENSLSMPDAQAFLKYTFGVNAWKLWVLQKNIQIEQLAAKQPAGRAMKQLHKTELLQCTPEELNYSLGIFVKEVRKPNGDEYAPDSIYYLCLGIQQYLYENGRLDNIFTDTYYDTFTDSLNDVLQRYEIRLNTQGMVVARIEEEHLWETRQLGAHSPFVLLNTLIYFNTKYFLLKSAEEHLSLSFTDIMKHWKKTNAVGGKAPGKMFFLRYFAPLPPDGTGRKRRDESVIFEQPENLENPLRCPVKLYEFYLSKCPESVRNRNDLFYLVPEKSCVPDSPVWYSTQALDIDMMVKMLSRLRIVRELQEIYLHQAYEVTVQM